MVSYTIVARGPTNFPRDFNKNIYILYNAISQISLGFRIVFCCCSWNINGIVVKS